MPVLCGPGAAGNSPIVVVLSTALVLTGQYELSLPMAMARLQLVKVGSTNSLGVLGGPRQIERT